MPPSRHSPYRWEDPEVLLAPVLALPVSMRSPCPSPRQPDGSISIRLLLGHVTYHHALLILYSPWSNLHTGGILSGFTLAGNICSSAPVTRAIVEVNRLLPRPSTSSPLENRAYPMASNIQTLGLEGLHHEMYGIAEQIKIMNEINALLIQRLATNNRHEYLKIEKLAYALLSPPESFIITFKHILLDYFAKDARMVAYLNKVKTISAKIQNFKIRQIPREENKKANALINLASAFDFIADRSIPLEFLPNQSIDISKVVCQAKSGPTWMDDIITYLRYGTLTSDKLQARQIQYRVARFCPIQGVLYKRSFSGPLLRYLIPEEADYVIREIHEGICENHSQARSLVRKAICQGYF
ncbi:hypothetical protein Acr_22g0002230 [Actinidia rufa]|uniref:RNase H type-1 domain-containing protein n=1 Tax=Actinidia rufa TaxID=165716 RepID=A0A7J0GJ79_9ERIC|nr:hypothetical protein Acr_22g0002230 [Actinidia rufa]